MDMDKYRALVWQSYFGKNLPKSQQLINNALGLVGEAGEVADQVKKQLFLNRDISRDDVLEELGDVLWHLACMATVRGVTLEEVAKFNITKLQQRYPDADWSGLK